jgi:hypothetical protein
MNSMPSVPEGLQGPQQVRYGPGEAIELPDDQHIQLPPVAAMSRLHTDTRERSLSPRTARDGPWRRSRGNHGPPSEGQDGHKFQASSGMAGGILLRQIPRCDATLDLDKRDDYIKCSALPVFQSNTASLP